MKSTATLFALMFVCFSVHAQEKKRTWVASVNAGAFLSISNVSLEKVFANRSTVSLIPSFGYFRSEKFTYTTFGIGTEYRYYFQKQTIAPYGYYGAAGISFAKGKADIETSSRIFDAKGYTTQAVVGKHWIFKKGIAIDAHFGIQYINLKVEERTDQKPLEQIYNWILPAFGAGVGYAF